jgi:hypothetical protein
LRAASFWFENDLAWKRADLKEEGRLELTRDSADGAGRSGFRAALGFAGYRLKHETALQPSNAPSYGTVAANIREATVIQKIISGGQSFSNFLKLRFTLPVEGW